jgi:hypothetical protein
MNNLKGTFYFDSVLGSGQNVYIASVTDLGRGEGFMNFTVVADSQEEAIATLSNHLKDEDDTFCYNEIVDNDELEDYVDLIEVGILDEPYGK